MSKNDEYIDIDEFSKINMIHIDNFDNNTLPNETDKIPGSVFLEDSYDGKKKVRFPEDNEIVSDYFESKNYWFEHKFCSSEELINSYKKACEHCNIKPIPILLEQLKGIDAKLCHERYDMLNMSNVKLDIKQIECMEEIFKRVQFKTLNFENSGLDDESSASLFEIIEFYESCLKLNISMNSKISYIGFTACSKMLKKTPVLESIEFKGIMFTDTTIPPLNRALRCGSNLKVLHMENSNICSKNLLILTSALKLNNHLKELHLSSNRMVPSDGIQLGSLLKVNRCIEILDVRNNSLGDIGLSHLCDGLCEQGISQPNKCEDDNPEPGLLCLILWSNSITHNGMPALSEALKINKSLQSLNLGNNAINSEGIHALRDGLLINRSLLRLSLPCCRITCEGGVAIAEYLADTKQLMRLDLRDNDIRTAGLMAISHSMKINKSLIRLDVDQVSKRDPNVKGFIETQTESLRLIQDRIQENKKAVIKNQEMEMANSYQGLSNNPKTATETNTISPVSLSNDVIPKTELTLTNHSNTPLSSPETISVNKESNIENIDPKGNEITVENLALPSNMSLEFSKDMETSFDSPSTMSNCFSNKVLSPTDTILEFNNSQKFLFTNHTLEITNNSENGEDEDLFLADLNFSKLKELNIQIDDAQSNVLTDRNPLLISNEIAIEDKIPPEIPLHINCDFPEQSTEDDVIISYDTLHLQIDPKPQMEFSINDNPSQNTIIVDQSTLTINNFVVKDDIFQCNEEDGFSTASVLTDCDNNNGKCDKENSVDIENQLHSNTNSITCHDETLSNEQTQNDLNILGPSVENIVSE